MVGDGVVIDLSLSEVERRGKLVKHGCSYLITFLTICFLMWSFHCSKTQLFLPASTDYLSLVKISFVERLFYTVSS